MYSGVICLFYLTCIVTFLTYPKSWVLFTHINSHTVHYHLLSATGHCWYIMPKMIISLMVLHTIPQSGSKLNLMNMILLRIIKNPLFIQVFLKLSSAESAYLVWQSFEYTFPLTTFLTYHCGAMLITDLWNICHPVKQCIFITFTLHNQLWSPKNVTGGKRD